MGAHCSGKRVQCLLALLNFRSRAHVGQFQPIALGIRGILAHLYTLRASLARARDTLMHFKDDRIDRDKLEPAARRVDQLMNLFASGSRDPAQGTLFVSEIQSGVEQVTNPKSADALRDAQVDIIALLNALGGAR
jgi:plasmid stabilization system protein ParE